MLRYIAIESAIGFIMALPAIFLFHTVMLLKKNRSCGASKIPHLLAVYVFCFVLLSIFSATGIPNVYRLRFVVNIDLVPFNEISTNYIQYIQNILLFMPFGFLLPLLWKTFEKKRVTFLAGMLFSLFIEIMQLFCHRATDIDDLMMNTAGTIIGYYLCLWIKRIFHKASAFSDDGAWKFEPVFCFVITFSVVFFVQPLISEWAWSMLFNPNSILDYNTQIIQLTPPPAP